MTVKRMDNVPVNSLEYLRVMFTVEDVDERPASRMNG